MELKNLWQGGKKFVLSLIGLGALAITVVVIIVILIIASVSNRGGGGTYSMIARDSANIAYESSSISYNGKAMGIIAPSAPASTPSIPSDKKVIKNGSLSLMVKNADDSIVKINSIVEQNGGFVENSNVYEISEGIKSGSVTIRVPSKNFDQVMGAVKAIAVKVQNENTNSRDVTAEYVDLEAQVANYKAEEKQYQDIMARASKIDDILNVAGRLAEVRGKIDRIQGQLNYLSRQVDMSSISITMTAEPEVKVLGIVWRPLTVLKQAFKSFLQDIVGFVDWLIRFVFKAPIYTLKIAVLVLIVWAVWRVLVVVKRKIWRTGGNIN